MESNYPITELSLFWVYNAKLYNYLNKITHDFKYFKVKIVTFYFF